MGGQPLLSVHPQPVISGGTERPVPCGDTPVLHLTRVERAPILSPGCPGSLWSALPWGHSRVPGCGPGQEVGGGFGWLLVPSPGVWVPRAAAEPLSKRVPTKKQLSHDPPRKKTLPKGWFWVKMSFQSPWKGWVWPWGEAAAFGTRVPWEGAELDCHHKLLTVWGDLAESVCFSRVPAASSTGSRGRPEPIFICDVAG